MISWWVVFRLRRRVLEPRCVDTDECFHRGVDALAVAGCEQVEKEPARHRHAEPSVRAGEFSRDAQRDVDLGGRREPVLDDPVKQLGGVRAALERLAVDLEEEALVGPQHGVGDVLPPSAHPLGDGLLGVGEHFGQKLSLARFDGADDLDPELLLGTEVMDQHAMAGPESGRERAQADVGQPVLGRVLDRAVQQLLPGGLDIHSSQCTIWYMKPVTVTTNVPYPREDVFDFLDVMANHEPFTDHMLKDWTYSGPERGIGSKAKVKVNAAGRSETVEIEVIDAERPSMIVEQNVSAGGRRIGTGTYKLESLPNRETRIVFEYAWKQAPLSDRAAAPLVRAILARGNRRAMARLAEQLAARQLEHAA